MKWNNPLASTVKWTGEISNYDAKWKVAQLLASKVNNNDVIGVGSGSTSYLAVQAIGHRIKEQRLNVTAIPTSIEVELACNAFGIPTTSLKSARPTWTFDGADEVDPNNNLIKGRGGAMLREKLLLSASEKIIIIVDHTKFVDKLGVNFAVPIEVIPEAIHLVERLISSFPISSSELRLAKAKDGPVITELGNVIFDVRFDFINCDTEKELKQIPGIVETGLFWGYNVEVLSSSPRP